MPGKTMIAVVEGAEPAKIRALTEAGAEVVTLPAQDSMVDLKELLKLLGEKQITSIMVEGGAGVFGSLSENRLIDKLLAFIAPILIGGREAKNPVEGKGVERVAQAMNFGRIKVEKLGDDILISGYPLK